MSKIREKLKSTRPAMFVAWLVAIVLLLDLFVVAVAMVSLWQSRLQYVERAAVQSRNLSQALVYSMSGIIETVDVALSSVVDEAEGGLARGGIEPNSINSFIETQHRRLPELDSVRMANAKGEILYGTGVVAAANKSVADRDYFRQLRDDPRAGLVISKPMIGRISGKKVIIVARRVNNPDGSFAGVVYGPITLERLLSILSDIEIGRRGGISLRDQEMNIIVRHPAYKSVGNLAGRQTISVELRSRLAAGETGGTFYTPHSWDNVAKTVSYRRVGQYPLYIIVALAASDYLAPWQRDLYRMSALVVLFIMVTLVLSRLVFVRWRREKRAEEWLCRSKEELELRVAERSDQLFAANAQLTGELAERERAEEKVRQGRNMLAQIIDSIPQAVFWKDRDSVFLGCNVVFAQALGVGVPKDVVGKSDYDFPCLRDLAPTYQRDDREVMESNRPKYHIIEEVQQADGDRMWVETSKMPLCHESGEVYGLLGIFDNITERKEMEESRNKALVLVESLLASSPTGILVYDGTSGDCIMVNQSAADILGGSIAGLRSQNYKTIQSWHDTELYRTASEVLADSVTRRIESSLQTSFGKPVDVDCFLSRFDVEENPHLMLVAVDVSEKKRLEQENRLIEAQMLHVQKLESLGVLAGGIAHDFNNILMVVTGNTDLALMRLEPDSPARENLVQIEHAAGRAADLARQMLAYSGKGRFVIENLDLTTVVREMGQMLEVSISKKTALRYDFAPDLPAISADATQLRQVILNLVINASEAIGDNSGVIAISTSSAHCDRADLSESWIDDALAEGTYVVLEVSDTGCGMEREIVSRIFDPFFTTKFTGRGLGMAAVLGIVRGHRGAIKVSSEPGKGTTFRLLLPALPAAAGQQAPAAAVDDLFQGRGTVLLVDDEEAIRSLGEDMLRELGFSVATARDGQEAIEVFLQKRSEIVCVLLDLTMPVLDGEQALNELRRIDPQVRVIISSGYNEHEVSHKFAGRERVGFIQKPYRLVEVSGKFREMLNATGSRSCA